MLEKLLRIYSFLLFVLCALLIALLIRGGLR